jgi:protein TonB
VKLHLPTGVGANKSKYVFCVGAALLGLVLNVAADGTAPLVAAQFPYKSLSTARGCATPEWPREALRYEIEGVTTIHFEIDAGGSVARPVVRKSSGWKLLDDAAMRGLSKCQFLPNLEEAQDGRQFPIQYVWKLGGDDVVLHPLLVPDSCGKSARFSGFQNFDRSPSDRAGILVRFLISGEGQAGRVIAEPNGQPVELTGAAVEYVKSCRFAIDPKVQGTRTDTLFGKVLVNPDSATGNSIR